ncbi:MAG TPA: DNA mismatch repair protein MutS [Candidatus Obscuribacterales bacterium]
MKENLSQSAVPQNLNKFAANDDAGAAQRIGRNSAASADAQLSPLMRQYWDIKAQHPDLLLFFRLGDFYELFDNDAHVGARELDITLTGRPDPSYPAGRVPMAGVPVKSCELYVAKLIGKGYSVAICEQVGVVGASKGPVERQVTRILTPGTVLESNLLPVRENNYLAAIFRAGEVSKTTADTVAAGGSPLSNGTGGLQPALESRQESLWGLACVDASCGEFFVTQLPESRLLLELGRLSPREILAAKRTVSGGSLGIPQEVLTVPPGLENNYRVSGRPSMFFQLEPCRRRIMQTFGVKTLEGFGCENLPLAVGAAGAVLEYLERTQFKEMPKFTGISTYSADDHLVIDDNARRNLELTETVRERSFEGSLLWCLDKTQTAMGSRVLRSWLLKPLAGVEGVRLRQDAVQELVDSADRRQGLSACLSRLCDLERLGVRLASSSVSPRDLWAIAQSLAVLPELSRYLSGTTSALLRPLSQVDTALTEMAIKIDHAISADAPRELTTGGIFNGGYNADLDEIRQLLSGGKQWIEEYQRKEQERTQIRSLKVNFNSTFGYYIEITHANKNSVPEDYIRKQTLTNAERYITPELKEYEAKVLNAEKNQGDLEYKLFVDFRNQLTGYGTAVRETAQHIAALDALLSLAVVAAENKYVRPFVDDSLTLEITNGRHPVLERILPMGMYVANDVALCGENRSQQMIILTGPNMSGKSSYLRQIAHIVLLAQMGSFVPAESAHIGIVDRIFTRIGAVDDLTQGQSTFLVEMSETTQCCLCATRRSLILLDEVGRGTSTYDGVAIAWAVAEYLCTDVRARTVFATHYHELNGLTNFFEQIANFQVLVQEDDGHVEFMHKVIPGAASRSFGINVASMAGLPQKIIGRAHSLMSQMQRKSGASKVLDGPKPQNLEMDEIMQLSLFAE